MIILISSEETVMSHIANKVGHDKKLMYIETASLGQGGDLSWREGQIEALEGTFSTVDIYDIEGKSYEDFEKDLNDYDYIHMGGGNTAYLLYHIRKTGFDKYLKKYKDIKIFGGSSAGAIVFGNSIAHIELLDDFSKVDLSDFTGLQFCNFDIWVHFGADQFKGEFLDQTKYTKTFALSYKRSQKGVYLDDDSYAIIENGGLQLFTV